ncbi:hypothetical protein Taro_040520 [Colocasia esculenta]|uniref:Uncharacterized protein n=1 Tax=Colocasia esculenta TaxID=4460 RepID=A0A843WQN6_COLES|nr:hypothetical protein [Colocasia esculenta]
MGQLGLRVVICGIWARDEWICPGASLERPDDGGLTMAEGTLKRNKLPASCKVEELVDCDIPVQALGAYENWGRRELGLSFNWCPTLEDSTTLGTISARERVVLPKEEVEEVGREEKK